VTRRAQKPEKDARRVVRGGDAYRRGHWAETLAAVRLIATGHRILARRWRCSAGEIDIVAVRGGTILFVEVKARADLASASEAVRAKQRQRLTAAAEAYLARRPGEAARQTRFDLILVARGLWPRHLKDAWRQV